jgi:hypothetical protein
MAIYAHDDATLFARALDSVLTQSHPDNVTMHVYLGVDGPIGPELEKVLHLNEGRIFKTSRSSSNIGLAATLNRLISMRSNEAFFFRMDADDISLPGRFMAQLEYFKSKPQTDILGTDIIELQTETGTQRLVKFCQSSEDARRMIAKRVPVAHPSVCIRARVFDKLGGYPARRGNEDIAMWFECMKNGFVFDNVPLPLLLFTVGPNFWKRRSYAKAFSEFRCYVRGIWDLDGITWRFAYPVARLALRLSPTALSKWIYGTGLRHPAGYSPGAKRGRRTP